MPKNVVIPSSYNGRPVTEIAEGGFQGCDSLVSLTIPNSVTSIGNNAFSECYQFENLTLPDSVTSIGTGAFYDDYNLRIINFLGTIDKWCKINFANGWANPLRNYGDFYLNGELIENLIIPQGITSINSWAFAGAYDIVSISIPRSVQSIGKGAFSRCESVHSISVAESNRYYKSKNNCIIQTSNKALIAGCYNSIIPTDGSVTKIGDYAFTGMMFESISIPIDITSIGEGAFENCYYVLDFTIPDSVTSIGNYAFDYCWALNHVVIGSRVTSIGDEAFYIPYRYDDNEETDNLSSLTVRIAATTPPTLGSNAFNLEVLNVLEVPASSLNNYMNATGWADYADKIVGY